MMRWMSLKCDAGNGKICGGKPLPLMYNPPTFPAMARPLNSPKDADWYACPSCGAEVRVGSRGCPQCSGKPARWEQEDYLDGVDAPEDPSEFDYNDFVKREFGGGKASRLKPHQIKWKWWITAVLLLAASLWTFLKYTHFLF
jgi:hypothetical protein